MALIDCIKDVCDAAAVSAQNLRDAQTEIGRLLAEMESGSDTLKCVINGPAGAYCAYGGVTHMTLAEALSRVNALSIAGLSEQTFTATAGQTSFTLSAAPANPAALEVSLNGAICSNPLDYTVTGTTLSFTEPLDAGDQVDTRLFSV